MDPILRQRHHLSTNKFKKNDSQKGTKNLDILSKDFSLGQKP